MLFATGSAAGCESRNGDLHGRFHSEIRATDATISPRTET
jgi:hypothetical protein